MNCQSSLDGVESANTVGRPGNEPCSSGFNIDEGALTLLSI